VGNAAYPTIAQDYELTFRTLQSLPCDVFLGAHGSYFGMEAKFPRMKAGGANPFVDPEGYRSYVATRAGISYGVGEAVRTLTGDSLSEVPAASYRKSIRRRFIFSSAETGW
jgi:hypothetical protein